MPGVPDGQSSPVCGSNKDNVRYTMYKSLDSGGQLIGGTGEAAPGGNKNDIFLDFK